MQSQMPVYPVFKIEKVQHRSKNIRTQVPEKAKFSSIKVNKRSKGITKPPKVPSAKTLKTKSKVQKKSDKATHYSERIFSFIRNQCRWELKYYRSRFNEKYNRVWESKLPKDISKEEAVKNAVHTFA